MVGVNTMVPACPEGYVVAGKKDEAVVVVVSLASIAVDSFEFATSVEGCIS